jgi:hypothetical protein
MAGKWRVRSQVNLPELSPAVVLLGALGAVLAENAIRPRTQNRFVSGGCQMGGVDVAVGVLNQEPAHPIAHAHIGTLKWAHS